MLRQCFYMCINKPKFKISLNQVGSAHYFCIGETFIWCHYSGFRHGWTKYVVSQDDLNFNSYVYIVAQRNISGKFSIWQLRKQDLNRSDQGVVIRKTDPIGWGEIKTWHISIIKWGEHFVHLVHQKLNVFSVLNQVDQQSLMYTIENKCLKYWSHWLRRG